MLGADFGGGVEVTNAAAPTSYSLTIYVDEGHSDVVGHVFVELSDGKNVLYRGFHPEQARTDTFGRVIAPLGLGGGEVQDDRGHHWDVRRSYNISRDGYRDALQFVEQVRKQHAAWCLTNHCGEFALAVANAAGIHLGLPLNSALEDRPGVVARYLRQHGAVTREEDITRCTADVKTRAAAGEAKFRTCGGCSDADIQEHIAQLRVFRDKELKACALIGLSPAEQ